MSAPESTRIDSWLSRSLITGASVSANYGAATVRGCTSVIAVDFFFWDAAFPNVTPSRKALDQLVSWTEREQIPLVLGDIPALLPGRQPRREALNQAIYEMGRAHPLCFLMPLSALFESVVREFALTIRGRRYPIGELVPNGLHLSEIAGEFLADVLADVLSGRRK